MFARGVKLIAGTLAVCLLMGTTPVEMLANPSAEEVEYMTGISASFTAGAHAAIDETIVLNDTKANDGIAVASQEAPVVAEPENAYANIAIAQVDAALNIRAEANEDAEVLGKLYTNGAATVLETLDGWYKVESGSVTGYVSADYVIVGDEEVCKAASERIATITTDSLKLRKEASTEAGVYTLLGLDQKVTVLDESVEGWIKVRYESNEGYISADFATLETVYTHAESKEEEAARLAAEEEARRIAAEEAARRAEAAAQEAAAAAAREEANRKTYVAPTGGTGQDVVNYAVQFVGNPYVMGGTSLTNGTDCSGFVMRVYEAFGVSLPRTSSQQRSVGYEVSAAEIQPGDIVCYSGHVAIYIGNGAIVHASNAKDGIKISSNWQYSNVITIRRIF